MKVDLVEPLGSETLLHGRVVDASDETISVRVAGAVRSPRPLLSVYSLIMRMFLMRRQEGGPILLVDIWQQIEVSCHLEGALWPCHGRWSIGAFAAGQPVAAVGSYTLRWDDAGL